MNLIRFGKSFAALSVIALVVGCASKSIEHASCDKSDWYELGRRNGAQGQPSDQLNQLRKDCAKDFRPEWETMFMNGRNAGLVEYCDPKNGYELGRMGVAYYYVCPSTVEPAFLSAYRKGQAAREIEAQNKNIEQKIDQLSQKMIATSNKYEQRQIASELTELKKTRTKNERELNKSTPKSNQ